MRSSSIAGSAATLLALLWMCGCAETDSNRSAASGPGSSSGTPTTIRGTIETGAITPPTEESTTITGEIDQGLQPYIDIAVGDLTLRLSTKVENITVTSATVVVWPDSSLGCPAPGQEYAQVTTDGALILLQVDGTEYPYHAGGSRLPFLCEKPGKSLTGTISTDL